MPFQKGHKTWNKGLKGKGNSFFGRKHTEEAKKKIRETEKGKIVSKKTRIKSSISHLGQIAWNKNKKCPQTSGERNGNWKGGITLENSKIRTRLDYKLWHKAVLERDNFICQKTGVGGGKLVAHHINNFSEKKDLRFAIDNGITLLDKIHKEFHKIYGIKNNTKEQLLEFLNQK